MNRTEPNLNANPTAYTDCRLQERHLRHRHGLSEPAARIVAALYYGETT